MAVTWTTASTTTAASSDYYYNYNDVYYTYTGSYPGSTVTIQPWNSAEKKKKKKEKNMSCLYQVVVVSLDGDVLLDKKVVAADKEEAHYEAEVYEVLKEKKLKPKDVTIIANQIGAVKVRPETKKVQIVKED